MVKSGEFREDLYFRLNAFQVQLPCLASYPERIAGLASHFAESSAKRQDREFRGFSTGFLAKLENYSWPGNVRELKNCIDFAVAISLGGELDEDCLPPYVQCMAMETDPGAALYIFPTDYRAAKSHFERSYLNEILRRFEGRINITAKETGLSKVTLIDKIRRYEIDIRRIKYSTHLQEKT